MENNKVEILIIKLLENRITTEEAAQLSSWLKEDQEHKNYFNRYVELNYFLNAQQTFDGHKSLTQIKRRLRQNKKKSYANFFKYAAIFIALIGLAVLGTYFFSNKAIDTSPTPQNIVQHTNNIHPGTNKAVLTLGNGSSVVLHKGDTTTSKFYHSNGKKLVYNNTPHNQKTELAYNYLTVPRGGQFFLVLADGTKVWLNADSKLKYPVKFVDGKTRKVQLLYGEAYFEVSPSTKHHGSKFRVTVDQMHIEVLGTQFNIKAYGNNKNKTYTTLVEGKIALGTPNANVILHPGQQAITNPTSRNLEVKNVNIFNEVSWRQGIFSFENKPLKDIMKVLSRWYDMNVVFSHPKLENVRFTGILGREQSIVEILTILKETNHINYTINNKTVIIS